MGTIKFENEGAVTYLVYELDSSEEIDSLSIGMLTNNKIPGLAATIFTQMNSRKFIKYNVSAKVSVKQFFAGAVNKKRLIGVFRGIVDAMISAGDYMLDTNAVVLDLDYIFADVSTCETVLIYYPGGHREHTEDLGAFFKKIMFTTQFDQTENCDHVAKIINYLNSTPVFSMDDFKKILDEVEKSDAKDNSIIEKPKVVVQSPVKPQVQTVELQQTVHGQQKPLVQQTAISPRVGVTTLPTAPAKSIGQETSQSETSHQGEKNMSLFYLLQHYNKDNVEIYRAQKAARKNKAKDVAKSSSTIQPAVPSPSYSAQSASKANVGFAVPGQSAPVAQAVTLQSKGTTSAQIQTKATLAMQPVTQSIYNSPTQQGKSMNFGETTVLGGDNIGETTVLSVNMQQAKKVMPHLIRTKNNEKIMLNKPVFRIGKEKSYVDYFIGDNTAISRSHANIISRDNEYFVLDTNSTNHTYVNGTMVQSNIETKLSHNDKICLANEEFEFKLY